MPYFVKIETYCILIVPYISTVPLLLLDQLLSCLSSTSHCWFELDNKILNQFVIHLLCLVR